MLYIYIHIFICIGNIKVFDLPFGKLLCVFIPRVVRDCGARCISFIPFDSPLCRIIPIAIVAWRPLCPIRNNGQISFTVYTIPLRGEFQRTKQAGLEIH